MRKNQEAPCLTATAAATVLEARSKRSLKRRRAMKIHELLDIWLLNDMIIEGYVRFGTHKEFPELRIFEYTAKTMFERKWNSVTMKTRGLIVNWDTKEVLARPFDKFFNYGEPSQEEQHELDLSDEVEVYDKLDGSLGIRYVRPDGRSAIATKGSFHSEQADWATKQLHLYMTTHLDDNLTWLFEIIYPENRIVVTYGFEGLVLLGARDIETGDEYFPEDLLEWKGRKATHFRYKTLREALEASPRRNAEGFVVYLPEFDVRVKIKQEDYLKLHKTVFSFGPQYIYDRLDQGQSAEQILSGLPDEFEEEALSLIHGFLVPFMGLRAKVLLQYQDIYRDGMSREEFADKAMQYENWKFLFTLFNKDPEHAEKIWKTLNPEYIKLRARKDQKGRKKKLSTRQRREQAMAKRK
jgi:RNA ligase